MEWQARALPDHPASCCCLQGYKWPGHLGSYANFSWGWLPELGWDQEQVGGVWLKLILETWGEGHANPRAARATSAVKPQFWQSTLARIIDSANTEQWQLMYYLFSKYLSAWVRYHVGFLCGFRELPYGGYTLPGERKNKQISIFPSGECRGNKPTVLWWRARGA